MESPQLLEAARDGLSRFAFGRGQGLLFAYEIDRHGAVHDRSDAIEEEFFATKHGLVWLHIDIATTPARRWIETRDWLPDTAKEMLLSRGEYPRLEQTGTGLAGILTDFHRELEAVDWRPEHFHFYADEWRMITARRHPLAGIHHLRQTLQSGVEARTGIGLLGMIIEALATLLESATGELERNVESAEDDVERDEIQSLRTGVGAVRKKAILLYRHIHREERVLSRLCAKPPSWVHPDDLAALHEALGHLSRTAEDLDTVQLRTKLLQEELAARLAEATNRNLYILSIVSAILLPMSLVAGIFGMNLGGLPGLESPSGFWSVVGIIAVIGFLMVLVLRWRKIL